MTTAVDPGEAVAALRSAVDQVLAAAWWRCTDAGVREAVVAVEREVARLDAGRLRLLAEADARGVGAAEGASSTAEWLTTATVSRRERAGDRVALAQALGGPLSVTGAALAAGAMTGDHAAVIARAMGRMPRDLDAPTRGEAEAFLVEQAAVLDPRQLARVARVLRRRLDGDAGQRAEREEDADLAVEDSTLVQDDDGRWLGAPPACGGLRGTLSAESGATLGAALDPLSAPAPASDGVPDRRSARQRRAGALVHLADTWLAGQTGTDSSHPRMTVTVPLQTALEPTAPGAAPCLLSSGHPLSPLSLAVLACDAEVSPVPVDAAGSPLDVGRTEGAPPACAGLRVPGPDPPGDHRPRRPLRLPQLHPAAGVVPGAPPGVLRRGRRHQRAQRRAALRLPPPARAPAGVAR